MYPHHKRATLEIHDATIKWGLEGAGAPPTHPAQRIRAQAPAPDVRRLPL